MDETIQANATYVVDAVKDTINTLFSSLFSSIRSTVFPLLDDIVFIGNDITEGSYFEKIFGTNLSSRHINFSKLFVNSLCFILWCKASICLHSRE